MFNGAILPHNIKKTEYSRFYEDSKTTNVKSKLAFPRAGLQVKPHRASGSTHLGDLTVNYAKSWGICTDAYVWGPMKSFAGGPKFVDLALLPFPPKKIKAG